MKKKILAIALTAAVALCFTACGKAAETTTTQAETTEEQVGMANPWSDVASQDEAAEKAGVGYFTIPKSGTETADGTLTLDTFRYMEELAEADGTIGSASICIRKGLKQNSEDVSGDYNEYNYDWTETVGDFETKFYGNTEGKASKIVWVSDNFSYSIVITGQDGISEETYKAIVPEVQ